MFPLTASVKRCPNGKELMDDATILMTFIGGGPYILRKPGKQVSLGRGSYMATIEILNTKFGFNTVLTPARSVVAYMGNVRSSFHFILNVVTYIHFVTCTKVSSRDVEVGVGPVAFNPNFAQQVTYLTWMYTHKCVIFSAIPQEVIPLLSLLRPFPQMVWLCFGGTMIFLTMIKYLFLVIQYDQQYSVYHKHINDAPRVIISMTLFSTIMFQIFYSESLVSCLVAKQFEQPIDTTQDLLDSGLTMHLPGKTAMGKYLADYPSEEMKQIFQSQVKPFPLLVKSHLMSKTG